MQAVLFLIQVALKKIAWFSKALLTQYNLHKNWQEPHCTSSQRIWRLCLLYHIYVWSVGAITADNIIVIYCIATIPTRNILQLSNFRTRTCTTTASLLTPHVLSTSVYAPPLAPPLHRASTDSVIQQYYSFRSSFDLGLRLTSLSPIPLMLHTHRSLGCST